MGPAERQGDRSSGAMAADGGCGESVEQYRAEVERLTQELAEANREKIRAAECGLVVLEENQALKQKYVELETEQENLRKELEQLQEVREGGSAVFVWFICVFACLEEYALLYVCIRDHASPSVSLSVTRSDVCCVNEHSVSIKEEWGRSTTRGRHVVPSNMRSGVGPFLKFIYLFLFS